MDMVTSIECPKGCSLAHDMSSRCELGDDKKPMASRFGKRSDVFRRQPTTLDELASFHLGRHEDPLASSIWIRQLLRSRMQGTETERDRGGRSHAATHQRPEMNSQTVADAVAEKDPSSKRVERAVALAHLPRILQL
eukprot:TRINITY_DN16443_c0_g1_i1.p2 TRINITY_DN16443_c0_g1~~TRINITY_DN16443_c0_g1_i1.p2  ORF type:complete len:147 (-),score=5.97 TRINITY_DN16443_c0_g1_i1:396-806(-)